VEQPSGISQLFPQLRALGPFFAVDVHAPSEVPVAPWQPLTQVLRPVGVRDRISQVREALADTVRSEISDVPWRVAASVAHLGLVARLMSPCIGAATLGLGELGLEPADTWWRPVVGGPVPLSIRHDSVGLGSLNVLISAGAVRILTDLFAEQSVSPRVLRGNVASALNGAYNALAGVRPDLIDEARTHAQDALNLPLLAGTSHGPPGPGFSRASCCLIYRLGAPGRRQLCGDCVLRASAHG
jgi:hypothetical protein